MLHLHKNTIKARVSTRTIKTLLNWGQYKVPAMPSERVLVTVYNKFLVGFTTSLIARSPQVDCIRESLAKTRVARSNLIHFSFKCCQIYKSSITDGFQDKLTYSKSTFRKVYVIIIGCIILSRKLCKTKYRNNLRLQGLNVNLCITFEFLLDQ